MVTYNLRGPDGEVYTLKGPPGASKEELVKVLEVKLQQQDFDRRMSAAMRPDPGLVENVLSGVGAGAVGLFGSAARGGAALLDDETEMQAREFINRAQTALTPEGGDPDAFSYKLGSGIGSILGFIPAAFAGPAALPLAGALGVGAGAGEARDRAMEAGVVGDELGEKTLLGGAVGATEILPLGRVFKDLKIPFPKRVEDALPEEQKAGIAQWLLERAKTGGYEAAQEGGAAIAQNLIEQTYNPEQAALEGAGEQATIGGIAGALVDALLPGRLRGPREAKPEVPPAGETAPAVEEDQILALGQDPFTPRVLPDGSVVTTPGEYQEYLAQRKPTRDAERAARAEAFRAEREQSEMDRLAEEERLQLRPAQDEAAEQRAFEATQRVARGQLDDEQGDLFAREVLDALEQPAVEQRIPDIQTDAERQAPVATAPTAPMAEREQAGQITIDEQIAEQRRDEAETREIEALIRADEQAAETQRIRDDIARREREQQVEEDWNLAEVNRAQEAVYGTEPESVAAMEAAVPEAVAPPTEQFTLPGVPGQKAARRAGAVAPEPSQPIIDPVTGETVPGELDYEEYVSRERAVTSDLFDSLGVNRNAGLRRQFQGRDLSDPQTRADLESAMTSFTNNPFASRVSRERIPKFLKAVKIGFGDAQQLSLFGPNKGPTNEARTDGRDKRRPRPEQPEQQAPPVQPAPETGQAISEVPPEGMNLVHGGRAGLKLSDIEIIRDPSTQKQGKKGRVYGGFYAAAESDAAYADSYAASQPDGGMSYDVQIKPGTKVLQKEGDITRLSQSQIDAFVEQGIGVVVGKDPRGKVEYAIVDKNAIEKINPRRQEAADAQAEAPVQPMPAEAPAAEPAQPAPVVADEAQGVGAGPEGGGPVDSGPEVGADAGGVEAPVTGAVGGAGAVVPAAADRATEQPGTLTDTATPRKLERLRRREAIVREELDDAEAVDDVEGVALAERELKDVEAQIAETKKVLNTAKKPAAKAEPAPTPPAEPAAEVTETPKTPETAETGKTGKRSELDAPEMDALEGEQGAFLERLGQPLSYLQPNDPSQPSDVETVNALLQGGAPTKGTSAQKLGALIYFGRMQRPIDAIREIAYTMVYGKPAKDGAAPRNRFEKGTPDEVKAFFEDKNQVTARAANEWAGLNLSDTLRSQLNSFISQYRNAELADAARGKEHKVATEAKAKREEQFQKRLDADMKRFSKFIESAGNKAAKDSRKDVLERAMQTLTGRRMILEALQAKGIDTKRAMNDLTEYENRLESAMNLPAGEKFLDDDGNMVSKDQLIENILDEANALELRSDALSASLVPLHPYVMSKLAANDLAAALKAVAMSHPDPRLANIANAMAGTMGNTRVVLKDDFATEYGLAGNFKPETNTITLDSSIGTNTHALMHEVAHALTSATLNNPSHPVTRQLTNLYEQIKNYLPGRYGVTSLDEFVAEAQSNPDFRRELNQINFDGKGKITAWQQFRNIVGNMLRRLVGQPAKQTNSALDKIDYLVDEILAPAPMSRPDSLLKVEYDDLAAEITRTPQTPKESEAILAKVAKAISARMKSERAKTTVDTVHEFLQSKIVNGTKQIAMGLMPLYPIYDLSKKYFPKSAPKFLDLVRRYNGEVYKSFKELGEGVISDFKGWAVSNREEYDKLGEVLIEGDAYGVDLTKPHSHYKGNADKFKEYGNLKEKFDKLSPDAQKQYRKVRATYDKLYDQIVAQIKDKITSVTGDKELSTALYNEFYQKLAERGGFDGYFPRQRSGDWTLKYDVKGADGQEKVFALFDSEMAMNRAADFVSQDANTVPGTVVKGRKFELADFEGGNSSSFLGGVMSALNANLNPNDPNTKEVKEQIMRLAVEMSPQGSIARSLAGRKQEYIRGFDTNILKVFTESVMRLKRREINLRYSAEFVALRRELHEESKSGGPETEALRAEAKKLREQAKTASKEEAKSLREQADKIDEEVSRNSYYNKDSSHPGVMFENELRERMDFAINPTLPTWSHNVRSLAYGWTLGLNPSSALIDMAAIPMIIQPMLAAQFPGQSAWKAIESARKVFMGSGFSHDIESFLTSGLEGAELATMEGKLGELGRQMRQAKALPSIDNIDFSDPSKLTPEQRDLDVLVEVSKETGQIQRFSVFDDMDAIGEGNHLTKLNAIQGFMMQASERFRRELSLVSYNKLALAKARKEGREITPELKRQIAMEAVNFTELTSGGNSSLATARYAQGKTGIGAVVMMYKRYGATMMYMQFKIAQGLLQKEDPQLRALAKRQAAFVMGQSAVWAGAMGMPLMGIVAAMYDMFADDDEDDFRTATAKTLTNWGTYGILDNLTGMAVSQRIALTDMLYRYDPNTADLHPAQFLLQQFGGPAYGTADKIYRGFSQVIDGNFARGAEQIVPTAVGNLAKGARYLAEGAMTTKGEPILEDIPVQSAIGQAIGFAPAELSRTQRFITVQKLRDKKINERRTKLFERLFLAQQQGDYSGYMELMQRVDEHNRMFPEATIDRDDIERSRKIREKINQERIFGMVPGDADRWRRELEEMGLRE